MLNDTYSHINILSFRFFVAFCYNVFTNTMCYTFSGFVPTSFNVFSNNLMMALCYWLVLVIMSCISLALLAVLFMGESGNCSKRDEEQFWLIDIISIQTISVWTDCSTGFDGECSSVKVDGANAWSSYIARICWLTIFSWVRHGDQNLVKIAIELVFVMHLSRSLCMFLKNLLIQIML